MPALDQVDKVKLSFTIALATQVQPLPWMHTKNVESNKTSHLIVPKTAHKLLTVAQPRSRPRAQGSLSSPSQPPFSQLLFLPSIPFPSIPKPKRNAVRTTTACAVMKIPPQSSHLSAAKLSLPCVSSAS